MLAGDAYCVVYAAPAPARMAEALDDLCRILAAGNNIVTTSISGQVYQRGSLPQRFQTAIREATLAGSSSIFSSGIEPGFGCDQFPIAPMFMSHKVYVMRSIETINYSEYENEYDMGELFGTVGSTRAGAPNRSIPPAGGKDCYPRTLARNHRLTSGVTTLISSSMKPGSPGDLRIVDFVAAQAFTSTVFERDIGE